MDARLAPAMAETDIDRERELPKSSDMAKRVGCCVLDKLFKNSVENDTPQNDRLLAKPAKLKACCAISVGRMLLW